MYVKFVFNEMSSMNFHFLKGDYNFKVTFFKLFLEY